MHVMMLPSGKIWRVYTADTLSYVAMPGRQTTTKITPMENVQMQLGSTDIVDQTIKKWGLMAMME